MSQKNLNLLLVGGDFTNEAFVWACLDSMLDPVKGMIRKIQYIDTNSDMFTQFVTEYCKKRQLKFVTTNISEEHKINDFIPDSIGIIGFMEETPSSAVKKLIKRVESLQLQVRKMDLI